MLLYKRTVGKILCASVLALAVGTVTGCSQPMGMSQEPDVVTPTEYMASVNAASGDLKDRLGEFAAAVIAGDTFTMESKSYEAQLVIDQMKELEAPEELSEVKAEYEKALADLEGALSDYTALYNELVDAQGGAPFDYGAYAGRIEGIQKQYDAGLTALEEADTKAAGDTDSSSSSQASSSGEAA